MFLTQTKKIYILILFFFLIIPITVLLKEQSVSAMFNINKQVAINSKIKFQRPVKVLDHGGYDSQYYLIHSYDLQNKSGVVPPEYASRLLIPSIVHFLGLVFNFTYNPELFLIINFIGLIFALKTLAQLYQINIPNLPLMSTLLFLPNIGLLTSFRYQLTETVSAALLLSSFLLLEKVEDNFTWLLFILLIALSLLTREAFIYAPMGLGFFAIANKKWRMALGLILASLPVLIVRKFIIAIESPLPLFSFSSIYNFAILNINNSSPLLFIQSNLFWIMIVFLLLSLYFIIINFERSNPFQFMALSMILFLGFFNPTSAWSNITGVGRHLALLFPILPLAIRKESHLKILLILNLVCIIIFFVWFFLYFPKMQTL